MARSSTTNEAVNGLKSAIEKKYERVQPNGGKDSKSSLKVGGLPAWRKESSTELNQKYQKNPPARRLK